MSTTQENKTRYFDLRNMTEAQKAFVAKHGISFFTTFANVYGFSGPEGSADEIEPGVFLCSRCTGWVSGKNYRNYYQVRVYSVRDAMAFCIGRDGGPKHVVC